MDKVIEGKKNNEVTRELEEEIDGYAEPKPLIYKWNIKAKVG